MVTLACPIKTSGPASVRQMSDAYAGVRRALAIFFGLVLAVIVLVVGVLAYWWHGLAASPDVPAFARSAAVEKADAAVTADMDARLQTALAAARWLAPQAAAVDDRCQQDSGSTVFSRRWVQCTRTETRYLAFDGPVAARVRAWDAALRKAGWDRGVPPSELDPAVTWLHYSAGTPGAISVWIQWYRRPALPYVSTDLERGVATPDWPSLVHRAQQPVDVAATARTAFAGHEYLLVLRAEARDYAGSLPSSSPSPTATHGHACYSPGVGDCPGG